MLGLDTKQAGRPRGLHLACNLCLSVPRFQVVWVGGGGARTKGTEDAGRRSRLRWGAPSGGKSLQRPHRLMGKMKPREKGLTC